MNFWKQSNHVMSYFKEENFRAAKRLPTNFMSGFLEVCSTFQISSGAFVANLFFPPRVATKVGYQRDPYRYQIELPEPQNRDPFPMCQLNPHAVNAKVMQYFYLASVEQTRFAVGL